MGGGSLFGFIQKVFAHTFVVPDPDILQKANQDKAGPWADSGAEASVQLRVNTIGFHCGFNVLLHGCQALLTRSFGRRVAVR